MVYKDAQYSIEENKNFLLIKIEKNILDDIFALKLARVLNSKRRVGIDLKNVETINSKLFIKYAANKKISFFNAKNEVLAYLSIALKNSSFSAYINFNNFKERKYKLTKRDFKFA